MAIKISELTAVTSIAGTEEIPVVQSATTKKATASQLKGYRSYVALVYYDGINAEINAEELQNDGFVISYSTISPGIYQLEDTSSPFLQNKTFVMIQQDNNIDGGGDYSFIVNTAWRETDDVVRIKVNDIDLSGGAIYNTNNIRYCSIEIRVYP